jgi:hypothetical protein
MIVKELRERLDKLDGDIEVVVQWEHDDVLNLFRINDVSACRGSAMRVQGKAGFKYESVGPDELVFINAVRD